MPLPQLTPKSSSGALFLALLLITLCSGGCQHTGERPSSQGALLEVRSGASVVSPQETQALLRTLIDEPSSVELLQRALLGQALREQGYGAQLSEGTPTWAQLLEVATQLSPEPSEEELKGRFERAYPQGLKLLGRQLIWRSPHLRSQEGRGALYDALLMWADGALKEARRAVLRGAPLERVASEHALSLLEGEALSSHLSSLHDPSLISSLKRLRAGELSPTLTSALGRCFYVRSANALTLAHTLKTKLPRAVTLTEPASQGAQKDQGSLGELNGLHRLCVETSREALSGATGRAFDASLRQELKALAELGALHQGSARAFGVTLQELTPSEWPVALTTEALKRAQTLKAAPQTPASRLSWLQFEAPDGLWLVEVRGAVEVSFEEVRGELKAQRARERLSSGEARLNLEQLWEELSPQLKVRGAGSGSSQNERAEWGSLPTLMLPSK